MFLLNQIFIWFNTGSNSFPFSLSEYSTVGGTVSNALQMIILLVSSIFSSFANNRILIPSIDLSDNAYNNFTKINLTRCEINNILVAKIFTW